MSKSGKSFAKGALLGAIGGALAGILFAPKSGKETREDIKKLAVDLGDKAEETYLNAKKQLNKKIENIKRAGKSIDEAKYKELIGEVVDDFKQNQKITQNSAEKLGEILRKDWEKIKKEIAK
ncbi:MAG: YtxH domain-containing protein [Candidatus Dojkabacteria bacterium]|jgi:gas vesicle protein